MKKAPNIFGGQLGFSLAEVLAALTIAAMVLVAVLGIYSRAQRSAAAITRRLDSSRLPFEVLQRIAEDLDAVVAAASDTKVTVENKLDNEIDLILNFKQTKDVVFVKADPIPSEIEEPNHFYNIKIPSEESSKITLELQAKIVKRVTKIKPEFIKELKK